MKDKAIVFVFAHQDDEILISGKIMHELEQGSDVYLIWCNDGSGGTGLYASKEDMEKDYLPYTHPGESVESLPKERISEILCIVREREARNAMGSLGVKSENMRFLKHPAEWMKNSGNIVLLIDELKNILSGIKPDEVYCDAWEGAHITHDITNFAAVHAVKALPEPRPDIFEFPQYPLLRSYKTSILKHFKKTKLTDTLIHLLHYGIGQFADERGRPEAYNLSAAQVDIKSGLVRFYTSQSKLTSDFKSMIKARMTIGVLMPWLRHTPDVEQWRPVPPLRNYSAVPCKGHRYSEYNQGIDDAYYTRTFGDVIKKLQA